MPCILGGTFLCKSPDKLLLGIYGGIHFNGVSFYFKRQWDACSLSIASHGA